MRVVSDTHAIIWFGDKSDRLSQRAGDTLRKAESSDGIAISSAMIMDLWYVIQGQRLEERHFTGLVEAIENPRRRVYLFLSILQLLPPTRNQLQRNIRPHGTD